MNHPMPITLTINGEKFQAVVTEVGSPKISEADNKLEIETYFTILDQDIDRLQAALKKGKS